MALSYEESKKLLQEQMAMIAAPAAMPMMAAMPMVAADTGVMTLDEAADGGMIAAYSEWTKSDKYVWYDQYSDDRTSVIDEQKNVKVDSSQINISQEENSQFIPFEMPRYYDGFDLMDTTISIYYKTSDGYVGSSVAVNVSYDTATIKFGWLVDASATHVAGNLKFEIRAIGVNSQGNAYVWKSKTFEKMNVLQSLIDDRTIELDDTWVQELVTTVAENVAEQIAGMQVAEQVAAAEAAATESKSYAEQAQSTVDAALANYYTKDEVDIAYATKQEISNTLTEYAKTSDLDGLATEQYVTDAIGAIDHTAYALKTDLNGLASESYVEEQITAIPPVDLTGLATEKYVTDAIGAIDHTAYATKEEVSTTYATKEELGAIDVTDQLVDYAKSADVAATYATKEELSNIDVTDQLADYALSANVYTKTEVDSKVKTVADDVTTNTTSIGSLNEAVTVINQTLASVDKNPRVTYEATYGTVENEDGTTQEYMFTLWETETGGEPSVKSRFQIMGGGAGAGSSVTLKIAYIDGYTTPIVATLADSKLIRYEFSGEDSAGDTNLDGTATWKVGNRIVATQEVSTGICEWDASDYVSIGDNKVLLTITHATGAVATKAWTVKVVDVRLESDFNDKKWYPANEPVNFTFTPYGGVDKTVHFMMDGVEVATKTSVAAASGLSDYYTIAARPHGTCLFEAYMTAEINGKTVPSNHIAKDIIWFDETSSVPVIGTVMQEFTARQYEATNIVYTVFDGSTETPAVTLTASHLNEDGEIVVTYNESRTLSDGNTDTWQFKTDVIGEHSLTITCGETVKPLKATITELGITVSPVTSGLVFDFNPTGRSNSDANRMWSYGDSGIAMTVSDNFDWINGGWQMDENGDQCFCIKAGTSAEINYEMFGDDAKASGKEMKLIFKTSNVADPEAVFMSCVSDATGSDKIGVEMKAQQATIYAKGTGDKQCLPLPYAEDTIIEFEFNITADSEVPCMVMGYEDGVSTRPLVYDSTHDFQQHKDYRKTISLGSPDCDVYIYRFKLYNKSLSDRDILNNFIADARTAEEMIARYTRNQIYDNGILTPEHLAEVCPDLRIIMIEAPCFTEDKDDKVAGSTIQCIYKGGDPVLDNWVATDCVHSGQGTSSNNYGAAGRNLDLIMKTYKDYGNQPVITLGDGSTTNKITLTRSSVPVNYLNLKVNIASSENANNALLAKRYNQFNPYKRPITRPADTLEDHFTAEEIEKLTEDEKASLLAGYQTEAQALASYVKDTMEFQNCVVFIKESDPDISTHKEFADCEYHLYAIGNVGDSKKTDDTRLTDPSDPYECILEVMDNTLPNSTMPTGKVDEDGAPVYPISPEEWTVGNSAYDALYGDTFDEAKGEDKENGLDDTYGWRYIYEDGTDEENDAAKAYVEQAWKDFYGFVVTSTDEEFKEHLGDWCVLDSVMYYYLFTLRYTMTDNHAKNSFWHYGKSNDLDSEGNPIRKWDLCFDYDNDTSLGIDNYGRMTYRYGYEEIDYVDGTSDWVWNAPQHVFFLRLRELFDAELCALYTRLESLGAWSSTGLINEFDAWQAQWPEELWRLDIVRKYIRTYTSSFINGPAKPEFLTERANGRKKSQRAQYERGQEKYMSSKFVGTVASGDDIVLRCSVPNTQFAVPANFDITLVPHAYVYLNVKYNTAPPVKLRAVPGKTYTIEYTSDLADIIEIYSASCLKSIGDLSACYLINGDFSNASKIRELTLGNSTEGYNNTNAMTLGLGSLGLLNKLDVRNMTGLTQALDLSGLKNLEELYAGGSGISGVIFADGGNVRIVEIPDVGSLLMKNLHYLTDEGFDSAGHNTLSRLVAENSQLDLIDMINRSDNLYQIRLVGINWTLTDTTLLERLYNLAGVNNAGGNADRSILSGYVFVPSIKEQQLHEYQTAWPDLEIGYNTMVNQFAVTFINADGTVLDVQYVDKGTKPVDPITRADNPIPTPTLESTVSTNYAYAGWDKAFVDTFANTTITATYTESVRQYTVRYLSNGNVLQEQLADYGSVVPYEGEMPTYTLEEGAYTYYLFKGWKQSGYVTGDKDIEADFDSCTYTENYFGEINPDVDKLKDLRPVEVYMLTKLGLSGVLSVADHIGAKDTLTIQMGSDFTYDDVEAVSLVEERMEFNGTNCYDTDIKLMSEDRDFVLAIDCEFSANNTNNGVLAQCFSGLDTSGFKIAYNNDIKVSWGSNSVAPMAESSREMLVLRHKKGENGVHVYCSNTSGTVTYYDEMAGNHAMIHDVSLVFGCNKLEDGSYENYGKGVVYWSKLWYADLGDAMCKKLAYWPHEEMVFEACAETSGGLKRYYLSDNSGSRSSISLISEGVLSQPVIMDSDSVNTGGWATYDLNTYLNTRVYSAFQDDWKQLLKQVKVRSSVGNKSNETSTSDCYIFVPSIYELDSSYTSEPYGSEGTPISHFTGNEERICYDADGVAVQYWTRSPSTGWDSYVFRIASNGIAQQVTQLSASDTYARLMITM